MNSITKNRQKYIGGSDIPPICEQMTYSNTNKITLYQSKHEGLEVFKPNVWADFGNDKEAEILDWVNSVWQGKDFVKSDNNIKRTTRLENYNFRANIDGINDTHILEIKTSTKHSLKSDYILQAMFYAMVMKRKKVLIAVCHCDEFYQLGNKMKLYEFDVSRETTNFIWRHLIAFDKATTHLKKGLPLELNDMKAFEMVVGKKYKLKPKEENIGWYYQLTKNKTVIER